MDHWEICHSPCHKPFEMNQCNPSFPEHNNKSNENHDDRVLQLKLHLQSLFYDGNLFCPGSRWSEHFIPIHGSHKKLKHFFKDFSRTTFIFQRPFVECHVTCLTKRNILCEQN